MKIKTLSDPMGILKDLKCLTRLYQFQIQGDFERSQRSIQVQTKNNFYVLDRTQYQVTKIFN